MFAAETLFAEMTDIEVFRSPRFRFQCFKQLFLYNGIILKLIAGYCTIGLSQFWFIYKSCICISLNNNNKAYWISFDNNHPLLIIFLFKQMLFTYSAKYYLWSFIQPYVIGKNAKSFDSLKLPLLERQL